MNIGIVIQARMSSSRLPGKILKPFYGNLELISVILHKLHKISDTKIIVATSDNPENNQLVSFLTEKDELVFRGSENDVLNRFIQAARYYNLDGVVRICSDNPFLDYHGIVELIETAKKSDSDYIGFRINNTPSILTHFGFWGEFVKVSALEKVEKMTEPVSPAHEHVTYYVYTHPNIFKCEWIDTPLYLQGRDDIRLTVDTEEDFLNAQRVYENLMSANENFNIEDVVRYLDEHTELVASMRKIIEENKK